MSRTAPSMDAQSSSVDPPRSFIPARSLSRCHPAQPTAYTRRAQTNSKGVKRTDSEHS